MQPVTTTLWCPIPNPYIPTSGSGKLYHGPLGYGAGKLVVLPRVPLSPQLDLGLGGDGRFLVATSVGNVMAALQTDGSAIAAEDIGGASCGGAQVDDTLHKISFSGTSTWLSAIEPSPAITGLALDAVALSIDGTAIVGTAQSVQGISPTGVPVSQVQGLAVDPALGGANDPQVPTPRDGYAAAFSRWAGGIFIAGGVARSDGSTLHDVWFRGVADRWTNVTPHAALGTSCPGCGDIRELGEIEAITYSFADNEIWILDMIPSTKFPMLRLSRAKPNGAIEQLALWVKNAAFDEYDFLALDHDGAVLISRARASGQGFFTARVEVGADGAARAVSSFVDHDDKLLGPPFVSPVGYGFFVQHGQTPKIVRQRTLSPLNHEKDVGALGDP